MIARFTGKYRFLSNFYGAVTMYGGVLYPTSEHAFQAAKTEDQAQRRHIRKARSPGEAKRLGQKVSLREDWDGMRVAIMREILIDKFKRHPDLAQKLLDTGDAPLVEGNTWGDRFWGCVDGHGENHLGLTLMSIRSEFRKKIKV